MPVAEEVFDSEAVTEEVLELEGSRVAERVTEGVGAALPFCGKLALLPALPYLTPTATTVATMPAISKITPSTMANCSQVRTGALKLSPTFS